MTARIAGLGLATALAAGCSTLPAPPEPPPLEVVAPVVERPPPEFPAVTLRVRRAEEGFVAEVLDVRGTEPDPRPIEGESRRDAIRLVERLLGDRARVVDPEERGLPRRGDASSQVP